MNTQQAAAQVRSWLIRAIAVGRGPIHRAAVPCG